MLPRAGLASRTLPGLERSSLMAKGVEKAKKDNKPKLSVKDKKKKNKEKKEAKSSSKS
jgi:hypothetical protein